MTTPANGSTPAKRTAAKNTPAKRSTAAKSTTGTTPDPAPSPERLAPAPTIAVALVCVPDELSTSVLTASRQLDKHLKVRGSLYAGFWAVKVRPWQRRNLIGLRPGRPAYCAGGPLSMLDVAGMRHAAAFAAGIRHQQWNTVVHGTRAATPWPVFERRHLDNPPTYPLEQAREDFDAQPRVQAMRMHNAANYGAARLDPRELEMFQARQVAYQQYHSLLATCFDAVHTAHDGEQLRPASDTFSDRITYLDNAARYLDTLDGDQRLVAVSL